VRLVRTIASGSYPAGRSEFRWRGEDERGNRVTAGLYFARLRADGSEIVRRIVWAR
jgi:flagellar hook assembly protein FlgD